MGEEERGGQLYVVEDGEYVPFCKIREIEFQPVKHKRISRKRFIKLCMAHGYSRNDARGFAFVVGFEDSAKSEFNRECKMIGTLTRAKKLSYARAVQDMGW